MDNIALQNPGLIIAAYPGNNEDFTNVMKHKFEIGDHVSWNSEAGRVQGKIIKIHTTNFDYKGYMHHANKEAPQYAIKSDKTDHIAVHKGSALTKIKD